MNLRYPLAVILVLLFVSCSAESNEPSVSAIQTAIAKTEAAKPALTATPLPTDTPIATKTTEPTLTPMPPATPFVTHKWLNTLLS